MINLDLRRKIKMKITRKELLEIIDSSLSEQSTTNPGSRVRASASRGQTNEMDRNRKQAERELQRTVDWFEDTVFPALESNREVVADELGAVARLASQSTVAQMLGTARGPSGDGALDVSRIQGGHQPVLKEVPHGRL